MKEQKLRQRSSNKDNAEKKQKQRKYYKKVAMTNCKQECPGKMAKKNGDNKWRREMATRNDDKKY